MTDELLTNRYDVTNFTCIRLVFDSRLADD